jgi:hypothetical protein
MKNRLTASLPGCFPLFIGRRRAASPRCNATNSHLACHAFQLVTKRTNIRLEHGFRDAFLGFRNAFAYALPKPFGNFEQEFIPETEPVN